MKTVTVQNKKTIRKSLIFSIMLFCGFAVSSYKSMACSVTPNAPTVGLNGHYTFTSSISGYGPGVQYWWNAGDGSGKQYGTSTFNHTYTTNNTFTVTVYASDSTCTDSSTEVITVSNVAYPCVLSSSFTVSYGPSGLVNFTSTSTGTYASTFYYWTPGDGGPRTGGIGATTYSHTYANNGYYGVWLSLIDTNTHYCMDSTYVYIDVTNLPCAISASFTYTVGTNGQVSFTNTSTGTSPGTSYTWYPGDTTSSYFTYSNSYTHTYSFNDTYNVMLVARDSTCSDSIVIPVTVTGACNLAADFTWAYDSNGQVKFTSTSAGTNGSTSYKWTFGDGSPTTYGNDTITHLYSFISYYTVTLVDSNAGGCMSSITKIVYVQNRDSLFANFIYSADTLNPLQIDFTSTSLGTNSNTYYKWTPGDGDPSDSGLGMNTYQHTYLTSGPYAATLTIWYILLPKVLHHVATNGRYDESSYTLTIYVNTAAGIQSVSNNPIYSIYPNPSDGSFKIAVNGLVQDKNAEIRISNMMGQVLYQSNTAINGGAILSDINLNAASGIYLLQVISNSNTYTTRIAIQK